jgi:hypothetical protein
MSKRSLTFVCPECRFQDFGRFCSNCGASLKVAFPQISGLLVQSLISTGYSRLPIQARAEGNVGDVGSAKLQVPLWIPEFIIDAISTSVAECPLPPAEFLAFDRTNVRELEVLSVLEVDSVSYNLVPHLAETIRSKLQAGEKVLKRQVKLKRIRLIFYVVFKNNNMRKAISAYQTRFSKRFTFKYRVNVSFVGISPIEADFYPQSLLAVEPEKRMILKSVSAQLHLDDTLRQDELEGTFWKALINEAVYKPTEGLRQLVWIFWSIITKPMFYAAEIDRERIPLATALSYLGLLVVFVTVVEKAVGLNELTAVIDFFPVVDEIIAFLGLLVVQGAFAGVLFFGLKLVGGKGTYKNTFITQVLLTVIFLPIAICIDSATFLISGDAYRQMTVSPGMRIQNSLNAAYLIPMYRAVHKISGAKVTGGIFLASAVIVGIAVLGAMAFS